MKITKINQVVRILLWVLLAASLVIVGIFVANLWDAESRQAEMAAATPMLYWTYCLLGCAAVLAIIFPIIHIILNPKMALKALISLVCLFIIVMVAYWLSSSEPITMANMTTVDDPTVLRFTGTGLYTTYILFGLSILMLIITGIRGIFKNA